MKAKKKIIILTTALALVILALMMTNAGLFNVQNEEKKTELETYDVEKIVTTIEEGIPVVQGCNESSHTLLSDGNCKAFAYRPKSDSIAFPKNVTPNMIKIDKFGTFLLIYEDLTQYEEDYLTLREDSNTRFVSKIDREDIVVEENIVEDNASYMVSTSTLSYAPLLMNTRELAANLSTDRIINIVVIDTGMYSMDSKPAKQINVAASYDFVNDDRNVFDEIDSHGTYVCSTILDMIGENHYHNINLINFKALENGRGSYMDAYTAIMECVHRGDIDVINCSWSGPTPNAQLAYAIECATNSGILVICSAGNDGAGVSYPAAYSGAIAISAIDRNKKIAYFSNRGPQVSFTAPGVDVCVDGPKQTKAYASGTSFSAPAFSGYAILMLLSDESIKTPNALVEKLIENCEDLGETGRDNDYGYGLPVYVPKKELETKEPETPAPAPETPTQPETPKETETPTPTQPKEPSKETPKELRVSFNATEGKVSISSKTVKKGDSYGELPIPTRECYTFEGWFTAQSGGVQIKSTTTVTATANHTLYAHWKPNEWSDWSTSKPSDSNKYTVEKKIQYRYSDKQFTQSTNSSVLSGWTLYDVKTSYGAYAAWSDWSVNPVSGSDTRQAETKQETYTYATGRTEFNYSTWYYTIPGTSRYGYTNNRHSIYGGTYFERGWSTEELFLYTWYPNPGVWGSDWFYDSGKPQGRVVWFNEVTRPETATGSRILYRYRDRGKIDTYYFYKWGAWSTWSDEYYAANESRRVEQRELYRWKLK